MTLTSFFNIALVQVLLFALIFLVVIRVLRRLLDIFAGRRSYRAQVRKLFPLAETLFWTMFALWAVNLVFENELHQTIASAAIAASIGAWLIWFVARDFFAGIVLKAQRVFERGQSFKTGEVAGVIRKVGSLGLELEQDEGGTLHVPYRAISGEAFGQVDSSQPGRPCTLELNVPGDKAQSETRSLLRSLVLSSPWVLPTREPLIRPAAQEGGAGNIWHISFFTLDDRFNAEVESMLRRQAGEWTVQKRAE